MSGCVPRYYKKVSVLSFHNPFTTYLMDFRMGCRILFMKNSFMNILFFIKLEKPYNLSPAIKAKIYLALRKKIYITD